MNCQQCNADFNTDGVSEISLVGIENGINFNVEGFYTGESEIVEGYDRLLHFACPNCGRRVTRNQEKEIRSHLDNTKFIEE